MKRSLVPVEWGAPVRHGRAVLWSPASRWITILVLVLATLAGWSQLARQHQAAAAARHEATSPRPEDAEWIWPATKPQGPLARFLVRPFRLPARDDGAPISTELRVAVAVDAEYELFVDDSRIGSGSYSLGQPLDVWRVPGLAAGDHRLVLLVRSSSGIGGAHVRVWAGEHYLLGSDDRWLVFDRQTPGLRSAQLPLVGSVAAAAGRPHVWGRSPLGRWGQVELGVARQPQLLSGFVRPTRVFRTQLDKRAIADLDVAIKQRFGAVPDNDESTRAACEASGIGPGFVLDMGNRFTGLLELPAHEGPVARVWFADSPEGLVGPPTVTTIPLQGDDRWRDAAVRTFRWIRIAGSGPFDRALVRLVEAEDSPRASAAVGPFGLRPPAANWVPEAIVAEWLERQVAAPVLPRENSLGVR